MMPSDPKKSVTLEDLLHLKRSERPSPEFWSQFERELRQKQLTALVQKRRWWHDLPVLLSRKVYVPAGAAAVVAFTLMAARYSTSSVAPVAATVPNLASVDRTMEVLPVTEVTVSDRASARADDAPTSRSRSSHPVATPATLTDANTGMTEVVGLLPAPAPSPETERPSARSIAANLARLEQTEPELVNAVMGSRLTPVRATSAVDETLAENNSGRKYRLIARYADHSLSPEPVAPLVTRERLARRLADDMNDRVSRLGVEGSQVSLKF